MPFRCDIKIAENGVQIVAPDGRLLPGRMLRAMMQNLENHYQVLEYTMVKNDKELRELDGVLQVVPLASGFLSALSGKKFIAFMGLHPSFYDENAVELSQEEIEEFRATIPAGEEMYVADFTVSLPADFMALVTDDLNKFCTVATHLKLENLAAMQECATRLGVASITIFDEVEMIVEYQDPALADVILEGLDDWLATPVHVRSLND